VITDCPQKMIPPDIRATMRAAAVLEKSGLPPVAGGYLDQSQCFLDAAERIWEDDTIFSQPKRRAAQNDE
jgi:hypothetical protein